MDAVGLERVVAAIRVVERLGQSLEGQAVIEGRESVVYAIDRETWEKRSAAAGEGP